MDTPGKPRGFADHTQLPRVSRQTSKQARLGLQSHRHGRERVNNRAIALLGPKAYIERMIDE